MPRMTEKQYEALRLYNALALSDKLRLDLMLQPGDIQLLSNHTQVHTRSAYVDHPVRFHSPSHAQIVICAVLNKRMYCDLSSSSKLLLQLMVLQNRAVAFMTHFAFLCE